MVTMYVDAPCDERFAVRDAAKDLMAWEVIDTRDERAIRRFPWESRRSREVAFIAALKAARALNWLPRGGSDRSRPA